jgi:hypothetical protein
MNRFALLLPSLLTACTPALLDDTFPTGSQTLIPNADGDALYVVDADAGTVVRHDPSTGAMSSVEVGLEPSRIARAGDKIFVTLRGERGIAVLKDEGGTLTKIETIAVGAEPHGIVSREDGTRIYVALSQQDEVVEIDAASLETLRTWSVGGHPSWLTLHPSNQALYAGSSIGGGITWISLQDGGTAEFLDLPGVYGAGSDGAQKFTRRITGDPSASSNGQSVSFPAMYLDNTNPVVDPGTAEIQSQGYGSVGIGVSRFNPSVIVIPTDGNGAPQTSETATVLVAGFAQLGDRDEGSTAVRSYLSSVTYAPDGSSIYATMEASSAVVVLSSTPIYPGTDSASSFNFDTGGSGLSASDAGFATSPLVLIGADAGPRGVAFLGDEAYVHSFLDRSIASINAERANNKLSDQFGNGFISSDTFRAPDATLVLDSVLDPTQEAGRRLFYSATSSQMAASGAGISCSTCHLDVRNDGVTWTFEHGVRQTPSLAGGTSVTAPFTWTSQVDSVSDEAQITSSGRMGGSGLSYAEAAQIEAFVDSIRAIDVAARGSDDPAIARGKLVFERADVACATCHTGERFTDNASYAMYGLEGVNTPTLVGIAGTGPYLHNGSAATIEDVLEMSRGGEMGDTSMLSQDEMADLAAYVKSL